MADYVLSAKGTYDGSNFDSGIEKSQSKLQGFMEEARSVGQKVAGVLGGGVIKAADGITSAIGDIGAGIAAIAVTGGIGRALNMEQAKTMFKGLKLEWGEYEKTISDAVDGTAFAMDAAALVAANLAASGVSAGEDMEKSLNGATGVAATFGADLADIGGIYQKVAAQGKLSGEQLAQLSDRGINGLSVLSEYLGKTQAEVREMVKNGDIDFATFRDAMYETFGESAKGANDTFTGVTANIRSNIAKIGELFATPALHGLQQVFAALLPVIKSVRTQLQPLADSFSAWVDGVVPKAVAVLEQLNTKVQELGEGGLANIPTWMKAAAAAVGVLSVGALGGLASQIPIVGGALGGLFGILGKLATPVGTLTRSIGGLSGILGGLSAPMLVVIALVAVMVAAFAASMATNEEFRNTIMGLVGDIANSLAPAFESIAELLPYLGGLFESVMNVVQMLIPPILGVVAAIAPLVSMLVGVLVPIIEAIIVAVSTAAELLVATLIPVIETISSIIEAAVTFIQGVIDAALAVIEGDWEGAWDIVQNAAANAWGVIVEAGENFGRSLSDNLMKALDHIKQIWGEQWTAVYRFLDNLFSDMEKAVNSGIDAIVGMISSMVSSVVAFFSNLWSSVTSAVSSMWSSAVSSFQSGVSGAISAVQELPGKILDCFSGAGSWLIDSGRSIIQGLIDGIRSAFSSAASVVEEGLSGLRSLFPFSPAKEGPFSGKGWVLYSGMSIMDALAEGAKDKTKKTVAAFEGVTEKVRDALDFGDSSVSYGLSATALYPELPASTYGSNSARNGDAGAETLLAYLFDEVQDLNASLGRKIADNAPVVIESERQAARRYRRAAAYA